MGVVDLEWTRVAIAQRDLERLQGSWRYLSGQREAYLVVEGDQFTMRFRSGDVYSGTLSLDPTARPRAMDMHIEQGPESYQGKIALAIYEFDGPHLIWSPAEPGSGQRRRAFPPSDDREALCIIFRRER